MKIKITDLVPITDNRDKWIAHLFSACVMNNEELVKKIVSAEGYNYDTSEVDMKLLVNGEEIALEPFLDMLEENFDRLVTEKAVKKFSEVMPKIDFWEIDQQKEALEQLIKTSYEKMVETISTIVDNHMYKMNSEILKELENSHKNQN